MQYLIDSADKKNIQEALMLGAHGITANTSMYRKEKISILDFVNTYKDLKLPFLSAEVIGTYEEMLAQASSFLEKDKDIVIKINFSKEGLQLVSTLSKQGYRTAITLVFTMSQALAAINAGVSYIFFFIGRNEEHGSDALKTISDIQNMIIAKQYPVEIVAASIKNLYQLETLASLHIDFAAIPFNLFMKSLEHPLTESGVKTFANDYYENQAIVEQMTLSI